MVLHLHLVSVQHLFQLVLGCLKIIVYLVQPLQLTQHKMIVLSSNIDCNICLRLSGLLISVHDKTQKAVKC